MLKIEIKDGDKHVNIDMEGYSEDVCFEAIHATTAMIGELAKVLNITTSHSFGTIMAGVGAALVMNKGEKTDGNENSNLQ